MDGVARGAGRGVGRGVERGPGTITFIIGGAHSGKSSFAERRAGESCARVIRAGGGGVAGDAQKRVVYVATGGAGDAEMTARIAAHRRKRLPGWQTVEEQWQVGDVIRGSGGAGAVVVVDCLTLLVSNLVLRAVGPGAEESMPEQVADEAASRAQAAVEGEVAALLDAARAAREAGGDVIVVSNEVGQGLVPPYPLGRLFRDLLGWANQALAAAADEVYLLVAGIPLCLRGDGAQGGGA